MCDVCKYVCVHMGGGGEGGVGVQMTYSICLERGGGAICRRVLRNTRTRSSMLFLLHFYFSLLKR